MSDPFEQQPVARPTSGRGKAARPSISPVSTAMRRPSVAHNGTEKEGAPVDPRLARLQVVPVDRIKASRYQHRDELNAAEDKEYQQLSAQIQADLEAQPDDEHRTIEHVFIVMPDPKDEAKLILASGGHRRLDVCLDLGVKEIYVWIKEYDEATLATGTYKENKGRKKTNWLEDARTYQDIMSTLGWNQTEVAKMLHVEGGQPHVSRCLSMLDYHPDLQRMLAISEERGMRAAKELARLEKHFGTDKARELWAPLIAGFLNEELYTDDIEKKVKQLLGEAPDKAKKTEVTEFPVLRQQRLAQGIRRKWQSFRKDLGNEPLDAEVRSEVETVYLEMGAFLGHTS
jgi:ParB/RepB/Spo0J family partition protein